MNARELVVEYVAKAWRQPFRGQIYDYAGKLNLQNGYAVKGPIQINTARHLIEPLMAIRDPRCWLVSVIAAVQTLKSLLADICNPFWIEHDPGDTLWLLEDDQKARRYAERSLGLLCSVQEIAEMLQGVERHDKTKTEIKFANQKLMICGLNPGNVQSLSWRRVIVDETWLHPFDGLIRQAMDRTKQYPNNRKVLLLGQGGVQDDDHSEEHKQTDQRLLHFSCPFCAAYQPFALERFRPETFSALNGSNSVKPDTFSGLRFEVNETTRPNGRWNFELVGSTAFHECFFCGHKILDTPDVRRSLNDSYAYFPAGFEEQKKIELGKAYRESGVVPFVNAFGDIFNIAAIPPDAVTFPGRVGYSWPAEASMRIPFKDLVIKYLRAKTAAEELGYRLPLQEFYQKDRGETWTDVVESEYRARAQESYDVNAAWPEECLRTLIVDCQRDLGKFFCSVFACAMNGEARELARMTAHSFDDIANLQTQWKVKDQDVMLDCGYQMTKVLRECVKRGHVAMVKRGNAPPVKMWLCWIGLKGSGRETFMHVNSKTSVREHKLYSPRNFYNVNEGIGPRLALAPWHEWSNLHCKDLLRDRRDCIPGAPKLLFLPDTLPATDLHSHFAQMRSEKRSEEWTPKGKRNIWRLVKESRPNHEWDKAAMLMAKMAMHGIIGSAEGVEAEPVPAVSQS